MSIGPVNTALALLLSPILATQAIAVRRRALILPEATGPRQGNVGTGPELRLLIVGDSSAAGVGVPSQEDALAGQLTVALSASFTVDWKMVARTGATTKSTLKALSQMPEQQFDVALTALGVNDLTRATPLSVWLEQQGQLRDLLKTRFGVRQLLVCGLPPVRGFPLLPQPLRHLLGTRAVQFDEALRHAIAGDATCRHLPLDFALDPALMAEDGFHPGAEVYRRWGEKAANAINEILADDQARRLRAAL